jgi:hypothetical protein
VNVLTIELALQQSLHIVRDINTPRGTRHEQIAAARERLQQFREKPDDSAPATERAA